MTVLAIPKPVRLRVLGTPFTVYARDDAVRAEVARLFAPFRTAEEDAPEPGGPSRTVHIGQAVAPGEAIAEVVAHLNATALSRADCLTVHAGVVGRGGRVAVFLGGSGSGKSTLVAACLQAGLEYVSDGALCVSWPDAAVRRYPRPLALPRASCRLLGLAAGPISGLAGPPAGPASGLDPGGAERYLTAADLSAATAADRPLAVAHMLLLNRRDRAPTALKPANRGEVAAALLARSFTHGKRPERAFELAHELAGSAQPWRLTLGHPRTAAVLIADLLAG